MTDTTTIKKNAALVKWVLSFLSGALLVIGGWLFNDLYARLQAAEAQRDRLIRIETKLEDIEKKQDSISDKVDDTRENIGKHIGDWLRSGFGPPAKK